MLLTKKIFRSLLKLSFGKTIFSYWVERGLPNFTREVIRKSEWVVYSEIFFTL